MSMLDSIKNFFSQGNKTMKIGDNNSNVGQLQQALNANGASLLIDNALGDDTANAAIQYAAAKLLTMSPVSEPVPVIVPDPMAIVIPTPPAPLGLVEINGFDFYRGDTVTSYPQLKAGGIQFGYSKATESINYQDRNFQQEMAGMASVGIVRGAYHFFHLDVDPVEQANYFHAYVQQQSALNADDFIVLDWETKSGDPYSVNGDLGTAKAFLEQCKVLFKKRAFVYVGYFMMQELKGDASWLAEYPLILPWYTSENKLLTPKPWSHWHMWQSSGTQRIPGLGNLGDYDTFHGDLNDLKALISYCNL